MSGGSVGFGLWAGDSSAVTLSGGSVEDALSPGLLAFDSSAVTIVGTGFAVDGVPVGFGPIAATEGTLTGTLESGELIVSGFCHNGANCGVLGPADGLIALAAPEPAQALLVLAGGLLLAAARRQRRA